MAIRFDHPSRTLWLSIGDLLAGMVFPGSAQLVPRLRSRAAMGRDLHARYQTAQQSRIPSYQAEVTLRQQLQVDDYTVHVHGRLDGLYEADDALVVEEIKSLLVPQEQFDAITPGHYPTYERQLALYIALLQRQHDGTVRGHLVLINLTDNACTVLTVEAGDDGIETLVVEPVRRILARYEARIARAAKRNPEALRFPFDTVRPYQAAMIEHVDKTIRDHECTLVSAPTGIGKTVAALYPALQHALRDGLRVFFRHRQDHPANPGRRDVATVCRRRRRIHRRAPAGQGQELRQRGVLLPRERVRVCARLCRQAGTLRGYRLASRIAADRPGGVCRGGLPAPCLPL